MTFSLRTVMDRAEVLLMRADPATDRPMGIDGFTRAGAHISTAEMTWPATPGVQFLLRPGGSPIQPTPPIANVRVRRWDYLVLTLSMLCGGIASTTPSVAETERLLDEAWQEAVEVLRWPNNHRRVETGWLVAKDFMTPKTRQATNRLFREGRFSVLWWRVR